MAVYVVIGSSNPQAIKQTIMVQYGATHYEITANAWVVNDPGTSCE
jgi:hypothetical protein